MDYRWLSKKCNDLYRFVHRFIIFLSCWCSLIPVSISLSIRSFRIHSQPGGSAGDAASSIEADDWGGFRFAGGCRASHIPFEIC